MDTESLSKNGWSEYGKLVLKELERLDENQNKLKKDLDDKCLELSKKLSEINQLEKDIKNLQIWKENVTEVWSVTQMKEVKNQLYDLKESWQKVIGIVIAVQVILGLILSFKDKLF